MINNFKRARLIAGLTQEELADSLGVSRTTVCKWESGHGLPRAKRIRQVADALKTTAAELLKEERAV